MGEQHYSPASKEALTDLLSKAANEGDIELYIESTGRPKRFDAARRLMDASGVTFTKDDMPEGLFNSILVRLEQSVNNPMGFAPRPEYLNGGMFLDPNSLAQVL